jgi:hypothetical protein
VTLDRVVVIWVILLWCAWLSSCFQKCFHFHSCPPLRSSEP